MAIERISVIPYARKKAIEFFATNLRPDREANFFFDETNVTPFVQNASSIIITGTDASKYLTGERIICDSTNSFATILQSISPDKLYINDNFITLKVAQYGACTLTSGTFTVGDIIYQARDNAANLSSNTFTARVEHWFLGNTSLVVSPISGTANTTVSKVLHSVLTPERANLSFVQTTEKFPSSRTISSVATPTKTSTVSTYSHNHGIITSVNPDSTKVNLASKFVGTVPTILRITEGSGFGQKINLNSLESDGTVAVLSSSISSLDSTSKYAIGTSKVDESGNLAGIFHLPENSSVRFKTGERLFTITDAGSSDGTDSTMKAFTRYYASGLATDVSTRSSSGSPNERDVVTPVLPPVPVVNREPGVQPGANTVAPISADPPPPNVVTPPLVVERNRFTRRGLDTVIRRTTRNNQQRTPRPRNRDPVAQTFFTPDTGYGIFLSSVDLFFKEKPGADDAQIPVLVRLVETDNGYPTQRIISIATVQCNDVNVSDGVTTFPRTTDASTMTKFTFKDPVFLEPAKEYALVVFSDSPTYEVWISELGGTIVGDLDNRRISEQPYIGSFFRSQNASTWTPYQNQDLMFRLNRAVFDTSPVELTFASKRMQKDVPFDELILNATEIEFPSANIFHKIKTTLYSDLSTEASFTNINPNKPYWFAETTNSLVNSGRRRIIPVSNTTAFRTQVILDSDDDTVSPFFNAENYGAIVSQNIINNGEIYNQNITITNSGSHFNVANIRVQISDSNLYPNVAGANATATVVLSATGNVTAINIVNAGKGYIESPTITISEDQSPVNATAVIISEDSKYGGNALCRYITRKITLADGFDSGDLRVTLRAIRPQGTNIIVYYKVQSSTDSRNFSDINWRRMYLENDFFSPDLNTAIDFKYNPSVDPRINKLQYIENGETYPLGGTFKHFSIKIVMLAECGCAAPTIRNLRAVALPEG